MGEGVAPGLEAVGLLVALLAVGVLRGIAAGDGDAELGAVILEHTTSTTSGAGTSTTTSVAERVEDDVRRRSQRGAGSFLPSAPDRPRRRWPRSFQSTMPARPGRVAPGGARR